MSCSLNARVSAKWKPVSRNRIGTSWRTLAAMSITTVSSAWKLEAIAISDSPESSMAQRMISCGVSVSNRAFSSATRSGG